VHEKKLNEHDLKKTATQIDASKAYREKRKEKREKRKEKREKRKEKREKRKEKETRTSKRTLLTIGTSAVREGGRDREETCGLRQGR
jgi:hypothetical protein